MSILNKIRDYQAQRRQKKISCKYGLGIIDPKEFEAEEGKSFFILGSAGSINYLTKHQWSEIEKGFSVGMNKWLIHDFVPDATSLEKNWHIDFYEQIYNDQRLKESKLKFLFYPAENIQKYEGFPFKVPSYIIAKIRLHNAARKIIRSSIQLDKFHNDPLYIEIVKEKLKKSGLNYEKKGSVYRLVQFAIAAGYRHIVFCGIDLNNVNYFWDNNDFLKKRGVESYNLKDQKGKIHATEAKSKKSLPMSLVIHSLQKGLKGKVTFETSSSHSKLAEFLSVWNPQK